MTSQAGPYLDGVEMRIARERVLRVVHDGGEVVGLVARVDLRRRQLLEVVLLP